jgi:hypothetical protein
MKRSPNAGSRWLSMENIFGDGVGGFILTTRWGSGLVNLFSKRKKGRDFFGTPDAGSRALPPGGVDFTGGVRPGGPGTGGDPNFDIRL